MIRLPAYFVGFGSKADGSASLRFSTQELNGEDFANFKRVHNDFGWLIFSENENEEIPEEEIEEEGKTASQILRGRMFVYWKEKINDGSFETWRKQQIDVLGQRYLDKLD